MKSALIDLVITTFLIAAAMCIREYIIYRKKPYREAELRRAIRKILDEDGCADALKVYKECEHLVDHYSINLAKCGFDGDMWDLYAEVGKSLERAERRRARICGELMWQDRMSMGKPL